MLLRTVGNIGLLFLFVFTLIRPSEANQIEESQLAQIKSAIIRSLCYVVYWGGGDFYYRTGIPLPTKIKIEGNKFYAKIKDVGKYGKPYVSAYQVGLLKTAKTGGAVVTHNFEIGMDKDLFFKGESVVDDVLTIPTDCTPKYDPMTPKKERMIKTIVNSMKDTFSRWVKTDIAKFPRELTLIIADFNIDYPQIYVLVEPMNEFFRVTLHDPQNYDKDDDEYMFGEEHRMPKSIQEKVRKHGIIRKIVLDP
jgi:hypothetical protein